MPKRARQPVGQRRLRRGVVRMAGLAKDGGGEGQIDTALPCCCRFTSRKNSRVQRNADVSTPSSVERHARSDFSCSGTLVTSHAPALATSVSTRLNRFVALGEELFDFAFPRDVRTNGRVSTPLSSRWSFFNAAALRWPCSTSCAPSAANCRAIAEPMPPDAPVDENNFACKSCVHVQPLGGSPKCAFHETYAASSASSASIAAAGGSMARPEKNPRGRRWKIPTGTWDVD